MCQHLGDLGDPEQMLTDLWMKLQDQMLGEDSFLEVAGLSLPHPRHGSMFSALHCDCNLETTGFSVCDTLPTPVVRPKGASVVCILPQAQRKVFSWCYLSDKAKTPPYIHFWFLKKKI